MAKGDQFGRKAQLFLGNATQAIDVSNLRFRFEVRGADTESPNTAVIRIYNLSKQSITAILAEYLTVVLQAGYEEGNFGIIFAGTVKQYRRGKESNIDSYLEVLAADGDTAYNYGFSNTTIQAGSTNASRLSQYGQAMGLPVDPSATQYMEATGGILPRGKVLFGLARDGVRDLAQGNGARWSIQNGVVTLIPLTGYLPGTAVIVNSATGMVGVPEATDNGINVRTLLNPLIKIGTRIQINNNDITQTTIKEQFFPSYKDINYVADVTNDGLYRVMVAEHIGDTRGQEFYTDLVCLAVDPSSETVSAYGFNNKPLSQQSQGN